MNNTKNVIKKIKRKHIRKVCAVFMMLVMLVMAGCSKEKKKSAIVPGSSILPAPTKSVTELETKNANEIDLTGVLTYVNTSELKMHFIDIDTGTEYEVAYTGGTDIQNKYEKIIAATGMKLGEIYDVTCNKSGKAVSIHGSSDAWERTGISGLEFDESNRKVMLANSTYVYASYAAVLSNSNKINIAQIVSQDEVTLRGVGDTVYSINVDKGHGYINFKGVDSFVGGYATIGTKQLFEVTSGMLTTTQEGTYTIELQKGSLIGTKTVTVARDESVTVDFSEFVTNAAKVGAVNFSVTPANAVMTIDGVETDYSEPVSLTYGTHRLVLSANNYEKYTETITISQPYETKVIDMTASSSTTATTKAGNSTTKTTASASGNKATTAKDLTDGYTVNITAPEGAALYVDSVYIGLVPCSFDKTYGNKTITLSQSGYSTVSYTIAIANTAGNLTYAFPDMVQGTNNTTTETTSE